MTEEEQVTSYCLFISQDIIDCLILKLKKKALKHANCRRAPRSNKAKLGRTHLCQDEK